jgi:hypothetical protein
MALLLWRKSGQDRVQMLFVSWCLLMKKPLPWGSLELFIQEFQHEAGARTPPKWTDPGTWSPFACALKSISISRKAFLTDLALVVIEVDSYLGFFQLCFLDLGHPGFQMVPLIEVVISVKSVILFLLLSAIRVIAAALTQSAWLSRVLNTPPVSRSLRLSA